MTQLIHLSLLLAATIQLSLISAEVNVLLPEGLSVTFKFPKTITWCHRTIFSKRVKVTNGALIFDNLESDDSGQYKCCDSWWWCWWSSCRVHLTVKKDCIELDYKYVNFSHIIHEQQDKQNRVECKKACEEDKGCRYFTFKESVKKCFLIANQMVEISSEDGTCSGTVPEDGSSETNGLFFNSTPTSWIDALEFCQDRSSSLVEIINKEVQQAVNSLLECKKDCMSKGVWIGLERSIFGSNSDPWMWISGTEAENPPWRNPNFLVDPLNNHCGKIIWEGNEFKWLDGCCHEKLPFICQAPT